MSSLQSIHFDRFYCDNFKESYSRRFSCGEFKIRNVVFVEVDAELCTDIAIEFDVQEYNRRYFFALSDQFETIDNCCKYTK